MPILFLHGVNVRAPGFERQLARVRAGLAVHRPGLPVEGVYWGDLGSALRMHGASIPGVNAPTRGYGEELSDAGSGDCSPLLLDDPLLELTAISREAADALAPGPEDRRHLERAGDRLARRLAEDPELAEALGHPPDPAAIAGMVSGALAAIGPALLGRAGADMAEPLERALTAALYRMSSPRPEAGLEVDISWSALRGRVRHHVARVFGVPRAVGRWAGQRALSGATLALRAGLRPRLMLALGSFLGDILIHPKRRAAIFERIDRAIELASAAADEPLWLVAHSLGGIIAIEYAAIRPDRPIDRLITVGSQVGFYAEIGALEVPLTPAGDRFATPYSVERWINVYDRNDILSFLAEPVFNRVQDISYDTGAPFPASHVDYWNQARLYEVITAN